MGRLRIQRLGRRRVTKNQYRLKREFQAIKHAKIIVEKSYPARINSRERLKDNGAHTLALKHIYIISIDEYERLFEAGRQGVLNIPEFLHECVIADNEGVIMNGLMGQHLDKINTNHYSSKVVTDAWKDSLKRIEKRISKTDS